ncbi:MAG: hypothetical protein JNM63_04655 [Spirochaetia bacterium]|nr:hypothetical protein [Spirochaetia bacterium]
MNWQHLAVFFAVTGALVYAAVIGYRKVKLFRAKPAGHPTGSGECPGCGTCEKSSKVP